MAASLVGVSLAVALDWASSSVSPFFALIGVATLSSIFAFESFSAVFAAAFGSAFAVAALAAGAAAFAGAAAAGLAAGAAASSASARVRYG